MKDQASNVEYREEVLNGMREMVEHGTDVRKLTEYLQRELKLKEDSIIPLLCYFRKAFSLQLPEIMPLQEWLGSENDREINEEVMPKIAESRSKWLQTSA